jgi:UPF0755 protein
MAQYYRNYADRKKKKSPLQRVLFYLLLIALGVSGTMLYRLYNVIFAANVWVKQGGYDYICIPSQSTYNNLKVLLFEKGFIADHKSFEWLAARRGLEESFQPGRYKINDGISNLSLIRILSSGAQEPVKLIFNNIRTKEQFAGRIAQQLETDSLALLRNLNNDSLLAKYGLNTYTALSLFIPNTYEMWWTTDTSAFFERMARENEKFWNQERLEKAEKSGMNKVEVIILASIVDQESNKNDEKSRIAGVYINRLKSGWPLQADPTLKFAANDFGLRRILNIHKEINSPYNTYQSTGLPPGPICIPSIASIDAVLNYEQHHYFFFCARDDLSGYHNFAATSEQHIINAEKYRRALNQMKIYK